MTPLEIQCDVYKSGRKENLYLYVDSAVGLSRVPADLMAQFGEPEKTLTFVLSEQRKLAREDTKLVLANLSDQGYHLQLPPANSVTKPLFPPSDRL